MARTAKLQRLTAMAVKSFVADETRAEAFLHDGGGLYLRKRAAVARWYLRLTEPATGAHQWHLMFPDDPLGAYPHKTLADARVAAKRLWNLRSDGVDPRAQRLQQIRAQHAAAAEARTEADRRISVRALFDRWRATDLVPRVATDGKRQGRRDGGAFTLAQFERRVFQKLGSLAATDVTRGDLLTVLDAVKSEGKLRTANILLSDLKQMFRFALARDIVQRNPLDTVSKRDVGGPSAERDRALGPEELRDLVRALPASGLQARFVAGVWLILATGVRVGELLGAAWSGTSTSEQALQSAADLSGTKLGYVDMKRRLWQLPNTKNQRSHTIHLSGFAVAQFRRLADMSVATFTDASIAVSWVFPNEVGTGPVSVKSFGKQLSDRQREPGRRLAHRTRMTSALMLPGGRWTAHDLRRTAATLMARLGISGDVIDECLTHMIESRMRRVYIRDRREPDQARAFDALGAHLSRLQEPIKPVTKLPARVPKRAVEKASRALLEVV